MGSTKKGWGTTDCRFCPQIWDGAGLVEATGAPLPEYGTQSELLTHLPGSACSHPGVLFFLSILPLRFAPTAVAAGKCLPGVPGFLRG